MSPLETSNPHGIRVVADRAPVREDAKAAFAEGSRKATAGIRTLTQPRSRRRSGTTGAAQQSK